ncbi:MAG: hypothetical protein Q7U60_09820, partial [Candidatus Methanoperedens sp.]|nr:hypothetical protein [Candidatus Methanoperedens sp.]
AEFENVKNWIVASLQRLIQKDGDLLKPESIPTLHKLEGQKDLNRELYETTINHRLACHLEYLMEKYGICGYHVDIEYNRYINNRKTVRSWKTGNGIEEVRPDIIVHKRTRLNEHEPHFLVVEAKKHGLIPKDCNHVKDIMHDENYRYKYGMLISYYDNPHAIQVNLLTLPNGGFCEHEFTVNKIAD